MTNSWRFSTLIDRHRALGSNLEDWSGMGTAWSYSKGDPDAEFFGPEALRLGYNPPKGLCGSRKSEKC